jgi:hypothetical protein
LQNFFLLSLDLLDFYLFMYIEMLKTCCLVSYLLTCFITDFILLMLMIIIIMVNVFFIWNILFVWFNIAFLLTVLIIRRLNIFIIFFKNFHLGTTIVQLSNEFLNWKVFSLPLIFFTTLTYRSFKINFYILSIFPSLQWSDYILLTKPFSRIHPVEHVFQLFDFFFILF